MLTYSRMAIFGPSGGCPRKEQYAVNRTSGVGANDGSLGFHDSHAVPLANRHDIVFRMGIAQRWTEPRPLSCPCILHGKGKDRAGCCEFADVVKDGLEITEIDEDIGGGDQVGPVRDEMLAEQPRRLRRQ